MEKVPLSALSVKETEIVLESPHGDAITLHMRPLKASHIEEISVDPPEAPVVDMKRDPVTGKVEQIRNEKDPTYLKEVRRVNRENTTRVMLEAIPDLEVEGETPEERVQTFLSSTDLWAYQQLLDAFNRVNGIDVAGVELEKEELTPLSEEDSPSAPSSDGSQDNGKT
jgi:hypothetical protein